MLANRTRSCDAGSDTRHPDGSGMEHAEWGTHNMHGSRHARFEADPTEHGYAGVDDGGGSDGESVGWHG